MTEYEVLLREGHIKNGNWGEVPELGSVKVTSFGAKTRLAMSAVKADLWEALPGWEHLDLLRFQHELRWPFDIAAPIILAGNEAYDDGGFKITQRELNVLDYSWHVAHHMHRAVYGKYSSNPRWLGFMIISLKAHSVAVTGRFADRIQQMRMSYELPS
jgi:hypothetical protein